MAGVKQRGIHLLTVAVLLVGAVLPLRAQPPSRVSSPPEAAGSLAGKLTDLYARALDGVVLTARNEATGEEQRTTTGKHGTYLFSALRAGKYTVEAESPSLGRGHLQGIPVASGHQQRLITAMSFDPEAQPEVAVKASISARPLPEGSVPQETFPVALVESPAPEVAPTPTPPLLQPPAQAPRLELEPAPIVATLPMNLPPSFTLQPVPAVAPLPAPNPTIPRSQGILAASVNLVTNPGTEVEMGTRGAEAAGVSSGAGRHWQDFALDTPTVSADRALLPRTSYELALSVANGPEQKLAFAASEPAGPAASTSGVDPVVAVQSVAGVREHLQDEQAIRPPQAMVGHFAAGSWLEESGVRNSQTGRGSNGFHGQLVFSDRQNIWGAQNPFTQWVKETAPATDTSVPRFTGTAFTPPDHQIVWEAGAGRHILRDRLFSYVAIDSNQRNDPGLAMVKHPDRFFAQPTNDQMQVLSARLALPSANPVVEGLSAYSKMLETLDGLLGPSTRTATQWGGMMRLDWAATERHRLAFQGSGANWSAPGGGLTRTSEPYGNHSFGSSRANEERFLARWEAFATPNLLAVTQGSMGRVVLSSPAQTPSTFEQTFLAGNAWGKLPQISIYPSSGLSIGNPARFGAGSYPDERLYEATQSLDWVHGALLLKAGFKVNHNVDATSLLHNQTGTYSYANVENFASDALAFVKYGVSGLLNPYDQHNCDQTGKTWRDAAGTLHGLGYLPCYSYFSQMIGPADWNLSTNDWAGYSTAQWQPSRQIVASLGFRWEREQMPPPIAKLDNPALPLTQRMPSTGNQWGPRVGIAIGQTETHWPVLRLGYGMYFGRTENATLETALTQTGSPSGDQYFFLRPTDNLHAGGAPPFPNVLNGTPGSVVKPGAVEFAPVFKNPEIHQAMAAVEEALPLHIELTASAAVSLGRRLPFVVDTNFDASVNPGTITYTVVDPSGLGPIKTSKVTVPFYASWPSPKSATGFAGRANSGYQQIAQITDRANSTYEAYTLQLSRPGRRGLTVHAHYTYSHAMDWNPNESAQVTGSDPLDPANFKMEYGTGNLDTRHSMAASVIYATPWQLHSLAGQLANGWTVSSTLQARSGEPYSMHTSGSLAKEFVVQTGAAIVALAPGMNGSGGDNRVYGVGRNTFRYPGTWKMDMRLARRFNLGQMRQLELLAESFNLMNHQNVTEVETVGYTIESGSISGTPPTLTFLNGVKANTTAFGQPLNVNATNFYRERQIQFGMRMRF